MIDCNKCNSPNRDDSLYCEHCGARLDTAACRKCGSYLPPKVKFCTKCGYPAEGNVCAKCGKVNPEDSAFCSACGNKLGIASTKENAAPVFAADTAKADKPAKDKSGLSMYIYRVVRAFTVSAILMCMFVFSFFGMFNMEADGMTVAVTGFDAVRGIFLLISPQTLAQNVAALGAYTISNGLTLNPAKALESFGVLRLLICEETLYAPMIMETLLWGLQSLALMVLSLVFFILTLIHAVKITLKKTDEFFKHDVTALALITALTFGFAATGGALAASAIVTVIFGCLGLGGILTCKIVIEKTTKSSVISNVRRGVSALLAVLVMCFAGSSLMNIGYEFTDDNGTALETGMKVGMDYGDVMDGMAGSPDIFAYVLGINGTEYSAVEFDEAFAQLAANDIINGEISDSALDALSVLGNPVVLCFSKEAVRSFGAGATAMGWLMYMFTLFLAAASVTYLFKLLKEEAQPEIKHKTTLWSALTMVGAIAMMVPTVGMLLFGNSISSQLQLGFTYTIGALPIVTAVLGIATLVCDAVMHKADKKVKEIVQ